MYLLGVLVVWINRSKALRNSLAGMGKEQRRSTTQNQSARKVYASFCCRCGRRAHWVGWVDGFDNCKGASITTTPAGSSSLADREYDDAMGGASL